MGIVNNTGHNMEVRDFIQKDYVDRMNREGYAAFWWYRAVDPDGQLVTFRFSKGGKPHQFDAFVSDRRLTKLQGPFKTRKAAHIG
jgi:hypothetical protein